VAVSGTVALIIKLVFSLIFKLSCALLSRSSDLIWNVNQAENIIIFKIVHDVVEFLRLLIFVSGALNSLANNKVLGDLGPHVLGWWRSRSRNRSSSLNVDFSLTVVDWHVHPCVTVTSWRRRGFSDSRLGGWHPGSWRRLTISLGDELALSGSAVPRPLCLSAATTDSIHSDAFSTWRNIHESPVLGCTTPGFAHSASRVNLAGEVVALFINGTRRGQRSSRMRSATGIGFSSNHELIVAEVGSSFLALWSSASCARNVHLGPVPWEGDINISLPLSDSRRGTRLRLRLGRRCRRSGFDHAMVDITVVRDNLSLNGRPADGLRRRRWWRRLWCRRRRRGPLTLNDAGANALPFFDRWRRRGRRRLWSLNISHNTGWRRSSSGRWLRRFPDSFSLVNSGARTLVLVVMLMIVGRVVGWMVTGRDTARPSNNSLLSNASDWAGTPGSVTVDSLYLTLAQDHRASFGSSTIVSQKSGCARLLSWGRADRNGAAAVIDFIESLRSRSSRSGVVIPLLKVGSPYTGHFDLV
jgi:hypothetical protein